MRHIKLFIALLALMGIGISTATYAQDNCPSSISVNETIGTTESVLDIRINCSGSVTDGYVGVQIEVENIKQAVYYISFAQTGSLGESSNYLFELDPIPIFPEQTIIVDVIDMSPGSSVNVVANKWGNSISQDATIFSYNLAYGALKFLGIQPAYSTDSRWERISTIVQSASVIPWVNAANPDGHPYWSIMESSLGVIKENAIENPPSEGTFSAILNSVDFFDKGLAIVELASSMPDIEENILAAANMLAPSGTTITASTLGEFFAGIKLAELSLLSGPRLAPTIVDLFYAPAVTSTRIYYRPPLITEEPINNNQCGRIVFVSDRDDNDEIYIMNPDGSGQRNISNRPYSNDFAPVWSPDGSMIAFSSQVERTDEPGPYDQVNYDIFVVNADGTNLRRITSTPDYGEYSPLWSYDSTKIAFVSSRLYGEWEGNHVIYDLNTSNIIEIPLLNNDSPLSWSPNQNLLALRRRVEDTRYFDVVLLDIDGGVGESLINSKMVLRFDTPEWSPDGTTISFSGDLYSDSSLNIGTGIYTVNIDGSGFTIVALGFETYNTPEWSPDGAELAFVSLTFGEGGDVNSTEIVISDIVGDNIRTIVSNGSLNYFPSWSPDSNFLTFANASEGEIYTISRAGDQIRNITNSSASYESSPTWSPNCNSDINLESDSQVMARLIQNQQMLLYSQNASEIWIRTEPDSSSTNFEAVPSGTLATIASSSLSFDGTQNWYQITTDINDITGWVEQSNISPLQSLNDDYFERVCPSAGGFHFQISQRFVVPFGDGATSIWAQPNSQPRVGYVQEGNGGYILEGPECVSGQSGNLLAWYIRSDDGLEGWMSEGYINSVVPWIVPLPEYQDD